MKKKILILGIVLLGLVLTQAWAGSVTMGDVKIIWTESAISIQNFGDKPVTVSFNIVYKDGSAENKPRTVTIGKKSREMILGNGYIAELANIQIK